MARALLAATLALAATASAARDVQSLYELGATDIDGNDVPLSQFKGKVALAVNVATFCGATNKNYDFFVKFQEAYAGKDVALLLFPCNDFASQEPRQNAVIKQFALSKGVDLSPESPVFMFSKLRVLGACKSDDGCKPESRRCCASEDPIYNDYLAKFQGVPSWNFAKYLTHRNGTLAAHRFEGDDLFDTLTPVVDELLAES